MSGLLTVNPLNLDSVTAQIVGAGTLRIRGSISMRAPSETLRPFFAEVHRACVADGVGEIEIDITELSFMNSSSIRVLITWLDWILAEPPEQRYVLHFRTKNGTTWQETTFSVLRSLDEDHVRITAA